MSLLSLLINELINEHKKTQTEQCWDAPRRAMQTHTMTIGITKSNTTPVVTPNAIAVDACRLRLEVAKRFEIG